MTESRIPLWLRELGHFAGMVIAIQTLAYWLEGDTILGVLAVRGLLLIVTIWLTVRRELIEYQEMRQSNFKTWVDLACKIPGLVVGAATVGWWEEL